MTFLAAFLGGAVVSILLDVVRGAIRRRRADRMIRIYVGDYFGANPREQSHRVADAIRNAQSN